MAQKSRQRSAIQNAELCYEPLDAEHSKLKSELLSDPVRPVTISQNMRVGDLVRGMADMSIQARNLGRCAQVLEKLYEDPKRQTVMLGLAGPLIAAGLRNVIRDLIVCGYVDIVVSTGAILYQDIY
jgi:deoxyhypusine synthase